MFWNIGKRLQERTKDKRKQGNFVSHVILSLKNIYSHLPPTADGTTASSACVVSRVTAERQSREKAKASSANSPASPGDPEEQGWLHSGPLAEGRMSFNSVLFSSRANCCVYQTLDCSGLFCFVLFPFSQFAG